jgi:hypothetical protein
MGLSINIKDGKGKDNFAEVTNDNELLVIASPYPPFEAQKVRPFRQYMTLDGLSSGSNDMGVDGSVTNVDFYIPAVSGFDRYITSLNILVGYGNSAQPFNFADSTALANGCQLSYESLKGVVDVHEGLKSNQDMFRLTDDPITSLWELRGINASNDYGYLVALDLTTISSQYGIKLDEGTSQKLVMKIKDDCTNADSFNIIAYGFERFE